MTSEESGGRLCRIGYTVLVVATSTVIILGMFHLVQRTTGALPLSVNVTIALYLSISTVGADVWTSDLEFC